VVDTRLPASGPPARTAISRNERWPPPATLTS